MHRRNNRFFLVGLIALLCVMSIGFAAYRTELTINGTANISGSWDVKIINITSGTPTGSATNAVAPSWEDLTANMEADLYDKGDAMEYDVTIKNAGNINAKLDSITTTPSDSNAVNITFTGFTSGEQLLVGAEKVIHVRIEYDSNYDGSEISGTSSITFNYVQA